MKIHNDRENIEEKLNNYINILAPFSQNRTTLYTTFSIGNYSFYRLYSIVKQVK